VHASKSPIKSPVWERAIKAAADPARVRHFLAQFAGTPVAAALQEASAEQARILAALFSGSPVMSDWLLKHPNALFPALTPERLDHPRQPQGLCREVSAWLEPALQQRDFAGALARLRHFKQGEMLRIAARDLARLCDVAQITRELSNVADVCLSAVLEVCRQQLSERLGLPYHQDAAGRWHPTAFCVLGLGKLGGHELNYSSDVDVMFLYSEEGSVFKEPPGKAGSAPHHSLNNHQYFKRLAEAFIAEVTRAAPEGTLYRIDLRLRPEGDTGPLARSLESYENYYAQWGQTWERMMLIKARCMAGDEALAAEFLEILNPFRYPRSLSEGVLQEVAAMKQRIENEVVKAGEIERNLKLGRGGIREVEFIVQTLQLLHAGRIPFLQGAQTLPALEKLVQYNLLARSEAVALAEAYCFLRGVEHRLQMENNLQTHTLPAQPRARERLAGLMGFDRLARFEAALRQHTAHVRQVYVKLLTMAPPEPRADYPRDFAVAEAEWKKILTDHAFKQVDKSFKVLSRFAHGPGYVHVSQRTVDLAWQLIPRLLALCPRIESDGSVVPRSPARPQHVLSDPDRVLARLDSFIAAYGTRAMLFETWASNPHLFELLVLLFDRSEFLAESAIRTPDLVDELVLSGRLARRKDAAETLRDLRHGLRDADQHLWLRRYHEAELMRLGLRDILGLADFEQNLTELSALAEACLEYALEVALRRHKFKTAPLVVIGLGKLGGQEVCYGSDLDIIFVADRKAKDLPRLQRVAAEVLDLLARRTEQGVVFHIDARLRPDGEKGLLVNALDAYETYYRQRAQLWEIQALSRARPVAGDLALGQRFQEMAALLTDFRPDNVAAGFIRRGATQGAPSSRKAQAALPKAHSGLAAYSPDWKQGIAHMRQRIERERTPAGQEALAIKTGAGGLVDAEFIAQTLCLAHGWHEPNTLRALQRARDAGALPRGDADLLIENYRPLRRIEGILRRWSFEGETELPVDPAPFYRVSVRCGFATPKAFADAVAGYRRAIRQVYTKVFSSGPVGTH
jgi:glutamate-ammonia-ligase adenylyltransferase